MFLGAAAAFDTCAGQINHKEIKGENGGKKEPTFMLIAAPRTGSAVSPSMATVSSPMPVATTGAGIVVQVILGNKFIAA